jgi:hypothetical protein
VVHRHRNRREQNQKISSGKHHLSGGKVRFWDGKNGRACWDRRTEITAWTGDQGGTEIGIGWQRQIGSAKPAVGTKTLLSRKTCGQEKIQAEAEKPGREKRDLDS